MLAASTHCYSDSGGHRDEINCIAFSTDYEIVLTGSDDCTVCIFNGVTHRLVTMLRGHTGAITAVAVSNDSKYLASGSYDRTIKLWQTRSASLLHTLRGHTKSVSAVMFSSSGTSLCSASWDKTAMLWNVLAGHLLVVFSGHSAAVQSVAFSAGDLYMATSSWDSTIRLWELTTVKTNSVVTVLNGHTGNVCAVAFSKHLILASGGSDKKVRTWNPRNKSLLHVFHGHRGCIRCLCFTEHGFSLASASDDGEIRVWSLANSQCITSVEMTSTDGLIFCGFHSCGSLFVAGATSYSHYKFEEDSAKYTDEWLQQTTSSELRRQDVPATYRKTS